MAGSFIRHTLAFLMVLTGAVAPVVAGGDETLTLAVKFVEFQGEGRPAPISEAKARAIVDGVNKIYSQCGIHVVDERYEVVDPLKFGLKYDLASMQDLDPDRRPFDDSRELVVINTGAWDHDEMGSPNAWTSMPGQSPAGAVIEAPVADDMPLVAHELGHYLGLEHVHDRLDLMNPVIYENSTHLTSDQCTIMRHTALSARSGALRWPTDAHATPAPHSPVTAVSAAGIARKSK